jgi:hypothetical protein
VRGEIKDCRLCGAPVFWAKKGGGANVPLDPEPRPEGHLLVDEHGNVGPLVPCRRPDANGPRYVSHFNTCPEWRR